MQKCFSINFLNNMFSLFYKRINVPAYSVISIYIYLKTLEIWGHVRKWFIKWYCLQYRAYRTVKENWKMSRIVLYLLIFPNLHKTVEFYILHKKKFSLQSAKVLYQVSMSSNNERNKVNFLVKGRFLILFSSPGLFQIGQIICLSYQKIMSSITHSTHTIKKERLCCNAEFLVLVIILDLCI